MEEAKVKSLYKALTLLDLFSRDNYELSITQMASESGMLKSSVHNIMQTFALYGIIKQNSVTGKYHLDKKVLSLSNIFSSRNTLQTKLKSRMVKLSATTCETVFYAIPYGANVIYVDSATPKDSFGNPSIAGFMAPMYCTGIGKAMLAYSPKEVFAEAVSKPLAKITENTITTTEELNHELTTIRERGFAVDNMEHEFGVKCVAVPIIENNEIIGALSISGPSPRLTDEKIIEYSILLKEVVASVLS